MATIEVAGDPPAASFSFSQRQEVPLMDDLMGKACLVTGGSRGIGRAIALELGRHCASVAVGYAHNKDGADAVAADIVASGGQAFAFGLDVADPETIEPAVANVVERFGTIDVLVNNAGITRDRSLAKMTPEEWDAVISTNLTSVFHLTSRVLPVMVKAGSGRIVNISSVSGSTAISARPTTRPRRRGSSASRSPQRSSSPARASRSMRSRPASSKRR
jgi:NAD(P)-dependent dehydrogenase (short-subunit alcohol dehydrogenase family)